MKTPEQLKILILAAEVVPFAKVGGLADVVGALPKALQALGHDVRVFMPRYGQVKPDRFKLTTVLDTVNVSMAFGTNSAGAITLKSVTPVAGSVVFVFTNSGTASFNGTMLIAFHL